VRWGSAQTYMKYTAYPPLRYQEQEEPNNRRMATQHKDFDKWSLMKCLSWNLLTFGHFSEFTNHSRKVSFWSIYINFVFVYREKEGSKNNSTTITRTFSHLVPFTLLSLLSYHGFLKEGGADCVV
jgi:hypothetical protein